MEVSIITEVIGWIGGFLFAISPIPQARRSLREGHSRGIEWGTLWYWQIGEICSLYYLYAKDALLWPLIVQYVSNIFFISIIIYFKKFPRSGLIIPKNMFK